MAQTPGLKKVSPPPDLSGVCTYIPSFSDSIISSQNQINSKAKVNQIVYSDNFLFSRLLERQCACMYEYNNTPNLRSHVGVPTRVVVVALDKIATSRFASEYVSDLILRIIFICKVNLPAIEYSGLSTELISGPKYR